MNKYITHSFLVILLSALANLTYAQPSLSMDGNKADIERENVLGKNIVPIDKGCVAASQFARTKLIEKQSSKFNLSTALNEIKASQLAFIQKSTLIAYLAYVDALDSTEINPTIMSSQYMLNCLTLVRH
jgi:hypothetical protein